MKLIYKKTFACISLLSIHLIHTTVEWSGTSCPDVLDQDVVINGDCQIQSGFTTIEARTANITITVPHDAVISSIDSLDPDASESNISLLTGSGFTITIIVKRHLTFKGSAGFKEKPLVVTVDGFGSVRWLIEDEGKLSFTADDNGGSAELWTVLTFNGSIPSHSIIVHRKKQVHFGPRSKWGYLLDYCSSVEAGTIIEHHHNTFIKFKDLSSFALEA
ncbi:MAG TPA: hypothetical protein VL201_00210 [Patescibacteria group bacterium]|jgi:hypothetical protein|nr:hypothetical protein [Patescibacteria group bacterium]